jgi:hypothetical protein
MKVAVVNPPWEVGTGIRSGCRFPNLTIRNTNRYVPFPFLVAYTAVPGKPRNGGLGHRRCAESAAAMISSRSGEKLLVRSRGDVHDVPGVRPQHPPGPPYSLPRGSHFLPATFSHGSSAGGRWQVAGGGDICGSSRPPRRRVETQPQWLSPIGSPNGWAAFRPSIPDYFMVKHNSYVANRAMLEGKGGF